jgi:hypothetical protein
MNANIRTIGGSLGTAVMASIVTHGAAASGLPRDSGYTNGFWFLAGASALALIAALAIPAVRRTTAAAEPFAAFEASFEPAATGPEAALAAFEPTAADAGQGLDAAAGAGQD